MRSDLSLAMSAISLLHAIGLLLLLLPAMHLADHPIEVEATRDLFVRMENKTDGMERPSKSERDKLFLMTFGLRLNCNGSKSIEARPPTISDLIGLERRMSSSERRYRRSNSAQSPLEEEPLQLPSSSRIVGPYFESNKTSISVSSRAGTTVMFDCPVALLQGRTVSWLRKKADSVQLLTVGNATYSSDSRHGLYFRYPNNWRLGITQVSKVDEGIYECQLSTHPTKALVFHLKVIAPAVQILDDNEHVITERHYKVDSSLHLTCRASHLDKAGESLSWFKGDRILPGGDSRIKVKPWKNQTNGEASAFLSIVSVRQGDSGSYSCRTSQASNSVIVHVLNEKLPAAVQHENSAKRIFPGFPKTHLLLFFLLFYFQY